MRIRWIHFDILNASSVAHVCCRDRRDIHIVHVIPFLIRDALQKAISIFRMPQMRCRRLIQFVQLDGVVHGARYEEAITAEGQRLDTEDIRHMFGDDR